ncbi:MAG: inosine/xanthosine triphosphatase, partial [Euryarchaeota archaeon]|nr:inosine/xanthosine triphosphatase [Euryarchaeota archaeon]
LAQDCFPISSTRIMQGEVDEEGKMLRPIIVGVGSNNPVKARAVRRVMRTLYGDPIIVPMKVKNSVGDQPWGDDTLKGAVERAKASIGSMDFGVGIEAGIFQREDGLYDIQYCAVVDKMGRVTIGQGSGFRLPAVAEERIRKGESVGRVFDDLLGTRDIGRKRGVIHLLTSGALTRQKLTEQSVMAAMVPRIRYDLYLEV